MVHTLAYANFQNRIFLALGVAVEPGGPLPPLAAKLDAAKRGRVPTPPRPPIQAAAGAAAPSETKPAWPERDFGEVQAALEPPKREPLRERWPLCPRVDVLPMPEPIPRPTRLRPVLAFFGARRLDRFCAMISSLIAPGGVTPADSRCWSYQFVSSPFGVEPGQRCLTEN